VEARVKRSDAVSALEGGRREVVQRSIRIDVVARDLRAACVDREKVRAVLRDLDPARGGLSVGVWRCPDRGDRTIAGDGESGDGAVARTAVRVRDVEMGRVGRRELAAKRPSRLGGEGRAGGRGPPAGAAADKAAGGGGAWTEGSDLDSDQARPG